MFPPSSAQGHSGLSLVWACLVVLEAEPWSLSMLDKRCTTELPCLLITLIHGCLPPCQSAPTAGGHGTEYRPPSAPTQPPRYSAVRMAPHLPHPGLASKLPGDESTKMQGAELPCVEMD